MSPISLVKGVNKIVQPMCQTAAGVNQPLPTLPSGQHYQVVWSTNSSAIAAVSMETNNPNPGSVVIANPPSGHVIIWSMGVGKTTVFMNVSTLDAQGVILEHFADEVEVTVTAANPNPAPAKSGILSVQIQLVG